MSYIKMHLLTIYHISWPNLEIFPWNSLFLSYGFQWLYTHSLPSWLVTQATSLPWHLAKQQFYTWHKSTTVWKGMQVYLIGKPKSQHHQNPYLMISTRLFLLKRETLSISRKWLDYLRMKDFVEWVFMPKENHNSTQYELSLTHLKWQTCPWSWTLAN